MAELRKQPGTSTPGQRQKLHMLKRRRKMSAEQFHDVLGVDSCTKLSSAEASDWIKRLGGGELANPPGKKPPAYKGKRGTGATRMISPEQIEQIDRLAMEYFDGDTVRARRWLKTNFKVDETRELATAKRGGEVIAVLKGMHNRRRLSA